VGLFVDEIFLECENGDVRIVGETALVRLGRETQVWRGPFAWEIGELVRARAPHHDEPLEAVGVVRSSLRLRPA